MLGLFCSIKNANLAIQATQSKRKVENPHPMAKKFSYQAVRWFNILFSVAAQDDSIKLYYSQSQAGTSLSTFLAKINCSRLYSLFLARSNARALLILSPKSILRVLVRKTRSISSLRMRFLDLQVSLRDTRNHRAIKAPGFLWGPSLSLMFPFCFSSLFDRIFWLQYKTESYRRSSEYDIF